MFKKLGRAIAARPVVALLVWAVLLSIGLIGTFTGFGDKGLFQRLSSSQSMVPGSESDKVLEATTNSADSGDVITLVVTGLDLENREQAATVAAWVSEHRNDLVDVDGVESVADPFQQPQDPRMQALYSTEKDGFAVPVTLKPLDDADASKAAHQRVEEAARDWGDALGDTVDGVQVSLLSGKLIEDSILHQVEQDLVKGEAVGLPVALLLMVIVFGGLIAAGLPLIGALVSIGIGLGALWGLTYVMGIDSFILNVISVIGLALSIDYGLLIVSRFREDAHDRLAHLGLPGDGSQLPDRATQSSIVRHATVAAVSTAGRTVFFSAVTIACAVAGLLVMRGVILRAIGVGAMIVVILAVLTALTLVPALLALVGRRLLPPSPVSKVPGIKQLVGLMGDVSTDEGGFSRLARWVHGRPWLVTIVATLLLVVMALPVAGISLRNSFTDYIPAKSDVHKAWHTLQDNYPALAAPTVTVVADAKVADTADLVKHLQDMDHVDFVGQPTPLPGDDTRTSIGVRLDVDDPVAPRAIDAVTALRSHDPGYGMLVGGPAALQMDFNASLLEGAGWAALIVVLAVLILLFLMTGSVLMPIKALLVNLLSLLASVSATWFIFQQGWFGLPQVAGMETFVVACAAAFGFGLAMDYEVFLLARIKEYWDSGIGNDAAVEKGLQRSGRIITSAAAIIVAVFLGFASGQMVAIKEIGIVLAIVVIVDATLVRLLLVPATMTLLGRWNWWAPAPLRRLHDRFHISH